MVKHGTHRRVGPHWLELESRVKERMPWISSRELSDRIAAGVLQSGNLDAWARVEHREQRRRDTFIGRLFR